ncbi:hypothetical protein [Achromobacter ruhlandii]|uniref:hypothetical protein n=1 Tax=Achromobacter ruhlandii TaxID=72557 RepID=UPI003B9F695D
MKEYSLPIRREEKEENQRKESAFGSFSYYSKIINKEIYEEIEEINNKNERRDTQESTTKEN